MAGRENCSDSNIRAFPWKKFPSEVDKKTGKTPIPAEGIEPSFLFIKTQEKHFLLQPTTFSEWCRKCSVLGRRRQHPGCSRGGARLFNGCHAQLTQGCFGCSSELSCTELLNSASAALVPASVKDAFAVDNRSNAAPQNAADSLLVGGRGERQNPEERRGTSMDQNN